MSTPTPLLFLDTETTGLERAKDRICSLGIMRTFIPRHPDHERHMMGWLINPTIPIPPEATAIHGITDEMVKDKPTFKDMVADLWEIFDGADLGGFNIVNFDLPILHEEFARAGVDWDVSKVRIFDAGEIFHKMNPRTLVAAARHYCDMALEDTAHDAEIDAAVSGLVAARQLDVHNLTIEEAFAMCKDEKRVDLDGRLTRNDAGVVCYAFGKAKGTPVYLDPGFGNWMLKQDFITTQTRRIVLDILNGANKWSAPKTEGELL